MADRSLPASIRKRIPAILALALTLASLTLAIARLDLADKTFLTSVEYRWIDTKFRWRGEQAPGGEVIIVAEDAKSLGKLGSAQTLRRETMADLIARLAVGSPRTIGIDILYPEPDNTHPDDDRKLAAAIQAAGNVVLGVHLDLEAEAGARGAVKELAPALKQVIIDKEVAPAERHYGTRQIDAMMNGTNLELPIPVLIDAAASFGFTNFHKDAEGRLRYQPQLIEYQGHLYPSLDLQLIRRYLSAPSPLVEIQNGRIGQQVQIGNHTIPTDQFGRFLLNFDGGPGTHQIVSMIDVLEGRVASQVFKDKIVLIGATAVGLFDQVTTPFASVLPGIELHANVIDTILHQRYLYRDGLAKVVDLAIIIVFGFVLAYSLPKLNASRSVFYSTLMLAAFAAFNIWAFIRLQWILSFVYPGLSLVVTSASLISYKYLTEEREKKKTKSTFGYYLDPHVIEQVMNQPHMLKLGGEKRELTVLFSDIRGFTSFSEKMAPAEVVLFLNQYFEKMQGIIWNNKGTLDKLIGDAVMCFWGAPLETKDHAVRGVLTALEMIQAVDELRSVLVLPGGAKFEIGIGLNTGPMVFGNMGSPTRFSYTVMGDNVNLGSRLESLNKYYGTRILISDSTFAAIRDRVLCRELDTIQVKGKSQAVTIYEPLGMKRLEFERRKIQRRGLLTARKRIVKTFAMLRHGERRHEERRLGSSRLLVKPEQEEIATMYEHALALYRKGEFDGAETAFGHVLSLSPGDGPSRLLKSRIEKYRSVYAGRAAGDGTHFDPVYKFDEK